VLDERVLTERLVRYETSRPEEIVVAAVFIKGWLEARDIVAEPIRTHRLRAGYPAIERRVAGLGKDLGPPWRADEKLATGALDLLQLHGAESPERVANRTEGRQSVVGHEGVEAVLSGGVRDANGNYRGYGGAGCSSYDIAQYEAQLRPLWTDEPLPGILSP